MSVSQWAALFRHIHTHTTNTNIYANRSEWRQMEEKIMNNLQ